MEKRETDEQLKSLSFDMDEEIDDRNERRGRRAVPLRHTHTPMDPSHAIILAAIIIVGGLWGGKLLYDYIQEQRIKSALNEAAAYMQQSLQQAEQDSRRAQAEMQHRIEAEEESREQRRAEQRAQLQADQARAEQEKRFQSSQCQFWWQQHQQNPSERTAKKKAESCEN
ncbi:hypothetical protein [Pseudomonas aeruginosa]|mgnify:CR=1 FL=1|uniref:hypothetical protein n=1 Tax=Pseudomonas aeruginosa TaxID=287 RepID=UPI00071BA5D0|nr:hypothetical protein [Pseudomonas aeruginosa]KSO00501.1 hypothetical protein APA96_15325 [Pseudomonas aeruginosa]MDP5599827.1 hypothetical protein [Pseudomonas aeruginosa]MED8000153.1 hypothetical protein [Pseudomonas aeruginosa]QPP25929.1 hypothetical protein I5102_004438 [Pseudomonas aeruginosa]HBO3793601.1 hypothetical protein [Pseudomonas aeruginosa]